MKKRFEDRISDFSPAPKDAPDRPAISVIERGPAGWQLTRRSLMGLLAAGTIGGLSRTPRAYGQGLCSTGVFAHEILISSLAFFPNGQTLVSAGEDGYVKYWTIPGAALYKTVTADAVPLQIAVSADGNWLAVAMVGGHLELWPAAGGVHRGLVAHSNDVTGVAFSADSSQLASVSADRTTKLWSVSDARLLSSFTDTSDVMARVAIPGPGKRGSRPDPQRRYLVTSGAQLHLRLLAGGAILKSAAGKAFAISPDSQYLVAQDGVRLYMYTFPALTLVTTVVENQNAASLSYSADGKLLAVSYTNASARLYSAPDLTLAHQMEANEGPCQATAMDPQNKYVGVASGKSIRLYGLPGGSRVPVCFMDLAASTHSSSGCRYWQGGVLYTIGCGATLPYGAECSCNCVPGNCPCVYDTGCACDSDTGCGCDSDIPCSCNSDTGCGCVGDVGCSCVGDIGCSCDSDYGCGCVDDWGCGCDGDFGCGCDGDFGCTCDERK